MQISNRFFGDIVQIFVTDHTARIQMEDARTNVVKDAAMFLWQMRRRPVSSEVLLFTSLEARA